MAKQRYTPYGYCIMDGKLMINTNESKIVNMIYDLYLAGNSYLTISRILNEKGIKYSKASMWNKNNVGRIIKKSIYSDDIKYPAIITKDVFIRAQNTAMNNNSKKDYKADEINIELKKLIYCVNCGSKLNSYYDKWICNKCDNPVNIGKNAIREKLPIIYNRLIEDISLIEIPAVIPYASNIEVKRMGNELNRHLDSSELDKAESLQVIYDLADMRFRICDDGSNGRNGIRIKECLQKHHLSGKLNMELIKNITDKIIVQSDGDFYILLKNGQEIK